MTYYIYYIHLNYGLSEHNYPSNEFEKINFLSTSGWFNYYEI